MPTIYTPPDDKELVANKRSWGGVSNYLRDQLGAPMRSVRQSWGAQHPTTRAIYSLIWIDALCEFDGGQHYPMLSSNRGAERMFGFKERERHMDEARTYNLKHYGVPVIRISTENNTIRGFDTLLLELSNKLTLRNDTYFAKILGAFDDELTDNGEEFRHRFREGERRTITTTDPERNAEALTACIEYYTEKDGELMCQVCGWTKPHGITKTIIEVHHLTPVSRQEGGD